MEYRIKPVLVKYRVAKLKTGQLRVVVLEYYETQYASGWATEELTTEAEI